MHVKSLQIKVALEVLLDMLTPAHLQQTSHIATGQVMLEITRLGIGNSTIDSETKQVNLNLTTVNNLNSYNSSWSKWLLNTNNKTVIFKVSNGKGFNISSQLTLLPSLAECENHNFSGWFEDEECTKEFTGSSVEADTILYGRLGMHCDL